MEALKPSQVFIIGTAGKHFTSAFYIVAYPVFLWHYLAESVQINLAYLTIPAILTIKFLLEFFFDILSSYHADYKMNVGERRRKIFLVGYYCMVAVYIILFVLASLLFFGVGLSQALVFVFLLGTEFFRTFGNAFESGAFDGWALSAELKRNPKFNKADMFAAAQFYRRLFLLLGAITATLLVILSRQGEPGKPELYWMVIWGLAALFQAILAFLLRKLSEHIGDFGDSREETIKARTKIILSSAFKKSSFPVWVLLASLYAMGMIITFTWPVVIGKGLFGKEAWRYITPLCLIFVGLLGASLARRYANKNLDVTKLVAYGKVGTLVVALALAGAGLLLVFTPSYGDQYYQLPLTAIGFLLITRFFRFFSAPFVDSLVHSYIEDERIRATVVSIRTAGSNFFAFLVFSAITVLGFIKRGKESQPIDAIGWVFVFLSIVVIMLIILIRVYGRKKG